LVAFVTGRVRNWGRNRAVKINRLVGLSVGLLLCRTSEPSKNSRSDRDAVWVEDSGGPREPCITWGSKSPHMGRGNFEGETGKPLKSRPIGTLCGRLCINGLTDRGAVLVVDWSGPNDAQVQLHSPGGANLPDDNESSVTCAKMFEPIDLVWVVDSGRPKEAQVQSYSPGGANVQSWENTLPPPGNTIEPSVCGGDAPYVKLL